MKEARNKKRWSIVALAAVLVILILMWKFIGDPLIGFISDPAGFRAWVEQQGLLSRVCFVGMVIFQVIVAIIPGEPFEIAAGYAFGAVEGTILSIVGAAIGSIITFWLVRLFGMRLVRVFFSEEKINSIRFLKTSSSRNYLFLIVYMIPGTPKDLLGYFAGLTGLPFPLFCLICTLGRFPSVITSTVGGNALGTKSYGSAALVFAVTMLVSALGVFIYNRICSRHAGGTNEK